MNSKRTTTIHDSRYRKMVELISKTRIDAGISQTDLAKAIGLRQPDISKIENHERRLDLLEFIEILRHIAIRTNDQQLPMRLTEQLLSCAGEFALD